MTVYMSVRAWDQVKPWQAELGRGANNSGCLVLHSSRLYLQIRNCEKYHLYWMRGGTIGRCGSCHVHPILAIWFRFPPIPPAWRIPAYLPGRNKALSCQLLAITSHCTHFLYFVRIVLMTSRRIQCMAHSKGN